MGNSEVSMSGNFMLHLLRRMSLWCRSDPFKLPARSPSLLRPQTGSSFSFVAGWTDGELDAILREVQAIIAKAGSSLDNSNDGGGDGDRGGFIGAYGFAVSPKPTRMVLFRVEWIIELT